MTTAAACVFCEVGAGRAPAHVVVETDTVVAFLDRSPVFVGHTLVVPRDHHITLGDLPPGALNDVMTVAQRVAVAVESPGFGAHGTFVAMNNRVSQSVAHLHVHVVPRHRKDGLRGFFWPRTRYESDGHAATIAGRLRGAIETAGTIDRPEPLDPSR